MLTALELFGFKSFADKTRFEFPAGITVIVGPNGSGKSNIVDAIKWVLGEQSAKSLRGQEMADVIFKGSAGSQRRPMNTAEATLIFDNPEKRLAVETPRVHITRRVYRSGEGEYLINGQPCRLRDIRDLFRGTGAGADAYSLIEQGKVDALLSAAPRDRRGIFEEAAGISRFKAKKLEASRRLERVEQNLMRLSDIVEEVESRLRSVKSQASKARRYQEHTRRLQQLRTHLGAVDWRKMTEQLKQADREISQLQSDAGTAGTEAEAAEAKILEFETESGSLAESLRQLEAQLAGNREQIAARESKIDHHRHRSAELDEQCRQHRTQLAAMGTRAGDLQTQLRNTARDVQQAESDRARVRLRLADHEQALDELTGLLGTLHEENEQQRKKHLVSLNDVAALGNQISAIKSAIAGAARTLDTGQRKLAELEPVYRLHARQLEEIRKTEQQLQKTVQERHTALERAQTILTEHRQKLTSHQKELLAMQARHTAVTERAAVLQELENRLEGLSRGVKDVLVRSQQSRWSPFSTVHGLVADLLQASVTYAPLIDVALGERAQMVVVKGRQLIEHLPHASNPFAGRVIFVRLDEDAPDPQQTARIDLGDDHGVIGRADRFVTTDTNCTRLVQRLLGRTWFVENLSQALALHKAHAGTTRFVTLAGELVESDGTVAVGPSHTSGGLISRRSELRDLRGQAFRLEQNLAARQMRVKRLEQEIRQQEEMIVQTAEGHRQVTATLAEHRARCRAGEARHEQLQQQLDTLNAELTTTEEQHTSDIHRMTDLRRQLANAQSAVDDIQRGIHDTQQRHERLDGSRQQHYQQSTSAKVELAKSEQRLENLHLRLAQFQEDHQERENALQDTRNRLSQCTRRCGDSERTILNTGAELANLFLKKEAIVEQADHLIHSRNDISRQRSQLASHAQTLRQKMLRIQDQVHQQELAAGELRHRRSTLADRLREDYGIELNEQAESTTDPIDLSRDQVETEIAELHRKINNIGAVNMTALAELDELESRHETLNNQFQDLTDAKESLESVIRKINATSRRLFAETLEIVRGNFQLLFRKVFGGGKADIVLEDGEDILESGIEIVATPPGKHSLNLSLLSGGERALTAVTLLLAIFQYRPSPFCVLDEVDGPLDEANIERFIGVLNEFLNWTKFVIVTHSKKTMTAATTLYGVTMQESGVSKRVSVQFDDISEDGTIFSAQDPDDTPATEDGDERGAA